MGTDLFEEHGLFLTRYAGPGTRPGAHRLRWHFGADRDYGYEDLRTLCDALQDLLNIVRIEEEETARKLCAQAGK